MTLLSAGDLYVAKFTGSSPAAEITAPARSRPTAASTAPANGCRSWSAGSRRCPGCPSRRCWSTPAWPLTRWARPRWTAARTSSPACTPARSTSPAPTTRTAARSARKAPPRSTRATHNRDGHIVEITETGDQTSTTFTWNLLMVCGDPATGTRDLLRRLPGGPGLADLLPGQRRVRLGGQPLDLHRRRALRHRLRRRAVQGHPGRCGARQGGAVPRRPARRRDLRARSSTTRNGPCSSPCSTRARKARSTRSTRTSRTTLPPARRRRPGQVRAPRPSVVQVFRTDA